MNEEVTWFADDGQDNFNIHLKEFDNTPIKCLQIGAYTGDASVWILANILSHPDAKLVDVDTWQGSEEPVHYAMNWYTVESLYDEKTKYDKRQEK
jgi:hypothetical protein